MKKLIMVALAIFAIAGISTTASAVVLPPGGFIFSTGAASPGGALVASLIDVPFTGVDFFDTVFFTGTLSQFVRLNLTGLVFEYKFTNDPGSTDEIGRLSTTNYTGFSSDVDASGPGTIPFFMVRSGSGSTVSFDFPFGGVDQGDTTGLLWIQTDSEFFGPGSTVLLDGGRASVHTFGPAIPEPSSLLLFGAGMLGLASLKMKKAA